MTLSNIYLTFSRLFLSSMWIVSDFGGGSGEGGAGGCGGGGGCIRL